MVRRVLPVIGLLVMVVPRVMASPTYAGSLGPVASPASSTNGRGVAVTASGDILLAGQMQSGPCAVLGVILSRHNQKLERVWEIQFNPFGCVGATVRGVVAAGEDAVVYGTGPGQGFISVVHKEGASVAYTFIATVETDGIYDAAVDPVDGSVWLVGGTSAAPGVAHILHTRVHDTGLEVLSDDSLAASPGNDTHAYAVAVTADAVFIGGQAYVPSPPGTHSWVAKRGKSGGNPVWSFVDSSTTEIWSLAARGTDIFAEVVAGAFPPYSGMLARVDASDGHLIAPATYFNGNASGSNPVIGELAMHPTLPLLAVCGGTRALVYDLNLSQVADFNPVQTNMYTECDGVAFSAGLDYTLYIAGTQNPAAINYMEIDAKTFVDSNRSADRRLLIAPNVLSLADPQGFVRLNIVKVTAGTEVNFSIYDAVGRFLINKRVPVPGSGEAEWLWDGTMPGGQQRIGPGGYLVRVDDNSGKLIARSNFLVVMKRGK